jgi:hypothetical protein
MLVCPRCNFHEKGEPSIRPQLCPRCQVVGKDTYLHAERDPIVPGRRHYDLGGLLTIARAGVDTAWARLGGRP